MDPTSPVPPAAPASTRAGRISRRSLALWAPALLATSGGLALLGAAPASAEERFADVPVGAAFENEIAWLAQRGISTGWAQGGRRYYRPVETVRRDAMAAFLYRLAGSPPYTPPAQRQLSDISAGTQFFHEMSWLASRGITTGYPSNDSFKKPEYRPLGVVNRDAMAAFMYRFAGSPPIDPPAASPFQDVRPTDMFYREICWMASSGISTGWPNRTFRP